MTTQEEDAFDRSRVQLTQTQDWCYHEGSYGHNPEYGATHILTLGTDARLRRRREREQVGGGGRDHVLADKHARRKLRAEGGFPDG